MENITIVGHVDITQEIAQIAADTWGGNAYTSAQELLQHEKVDAAWVCVPPFAHGAIEATFLEAGVPMYIEKPVGVDMAVPSEIGQAIGSKQAIVNVGYYWRCLEVLPKLREMLAKTPPQMVRIAYHGPTAPAGWWRVKAKSGGQVVEQATHLVDIARVLLGEAQVEKALTAHYDRAAFPGTDIATSTAALLQFESGLFGTFTATCVLDSFVDTAIEFFCEGRKITLSLKELHIDTAEGRVSESTGEDPLVLADRAFIAAVTNNDLTALPCPYNEALKTQQLCCDIEAASQKDTN